jgi:Leucine-rich repeat (LRR) protein
MRAALIVFLVACGSPAKPPVKPVPPPVVVVAPKPAPLWPVPMRVMTWTPDGLVQIGLLPDSPPAQPPATPWYVEPARTLDEPTFAAIVDAVRKEHVPGLSLRAQPVTSAWLARLNDLPELTALVLDDSDVDTAALRMTKLSLKRLYLARTRIDDTAMTWLASEHPLEVLDIEDCVIGDAGFTALTGISSLRAINASGTRITDAGGAQLGKLAQLEVADLGRTLVGPKTVGALAPRALHQLFLDKTHAGRAVAKLARMAPRIERIDLSSLVGYRPTDADVAWLATAPNLVEVGLSKSRVSDKIVVAIAQLPHLEEVRLAGTQITSKSIDKLALRNELEEIDLADTAVTDANAVALFQLPNLRVLRLDKTAVTDAGLATPGPALVELYLSSTKVTDAGLAILDNTPKLEALALGYTAARDATIARIAKLTSLRTLVLSGTRADHEVLVQLGKLTELERLYLEETHTETAVVLALAGRPLRVLHVSTTNVSDEALAALRSFTLLEELTLGDTRLTPAIVQAISAWPRLRTLSLVGLELGDAELPLIAGARRLERLDLSATDVTNPAPLAALANLTELGLSQTKLTTAGKTAANALAKRGVVVVR